MKQDGVLRRNCVWGCLGLVALTALSGCLTAPPSEHPTFPAYTPPVVKLQPGDVLQVKFTYWPELNGDPQTIRPDGKLALPLVGDVTAADRTPDELRTDLLSLYADKLKEPDIQVVVTQLVSQRVYVGGEVLNPGMIPMQGKITLLEAIMQAGGFNKTTAQLRNVVVVRQREGKLYSKAVDLRTAIEQPESAPFYLEPYDVVFVPRTVIDRVDQFVDQYINQIVPRGLYWNMTYDLNDQEFSSDSRTYQIQGASGL